ncbi:MAG: NfeD family protein [Prosthecobacter sp.]
MLANIAILTLLGILLIMLETFLPGGVAGIIGGACILVAAILPLVADDFNHWTSGQRYLLTAGVFVTVALALFVWLRWFAVRFFKHGLTLSATVGHVPRDEHLTGKQGVALTELRPLGRAEIDGRRYEVRCQSGSAPTGARIEVISHEPGNLLVRTLS